MYAYKYTNFRHMYVSMYICIHICTCIYACYTCIHLGMYIGRHALVCMCMHIWLYEFVHICTYVGRHMYMHTHYRYACIHTFVYMYAYT